MTLFNVTDSIFLNCRLFIPIASTRGALLIAPRFIHGSCDLTSDFSVGPWLVHVRVELSDSV